METLVYIAILLLGGVGLFILGSILRGWVLSILWGWFVVPVFSLPNLTVVQAIGISLIIGFLTYQSDAKSNDTDDDRKSKARVTITLSIVYPLLALLSDL